MGCGHVEEMAAQKERRVGEGMGKLEVRLKECCAMKGSFVYLMVSKRFFLFDIPTRLSLTRDFCSLTKPVFSRLCT